VEQQEVTISDLKKNEHTTIDAATFTLMRILSGAEFSPHN